MLREILAQSLCRGGTAKARKVWGVNCTCKGHKSIYPFRTLKGPATPVQASDTETWGPNLIFAKIQSFDNLNTTFHCTPYGQLFLLAAARCLRFIPSSLIPRGCPIKRNFRVLLFLSEGKVITISSYIGHGSVRDRSIKDDAEVFGSRMGQNEVSGVLRAQHLSRR